jgi:hypothetical protein
MLLLANPLTPVTMETDVSLCVKERVAGAGMVRSIYNALPFIMDTMTYIIEKLLRFFNKETGSSRILLHRMHYPVDGKKRLLFFLKRHRKGNPKSI